MSYRLIVMLVASISFPLSAADLEFEGIPSVKVEMLEGVTQTSPVLRERARELAVRIVKTSDGYAWASRNNVPLTKRQSGVYITYIASTGAGYIRVLDPSMRNALNRLPEGHKDAEFTYMEHMVNQLGSVTYFGK